MGESLLRAGRDVVLAAFQLQEHPDSPRHREHLAAAARRSLMETAKVRGHREGTQQREEAPADPWSTPLLLPPAPGMKWEWEFLT